MLHVRDVLRYNDHLPITDIYNTKCSYHHYFWNLDHNEVNKILKRNVIKLVSVNYRGLNSNAHQCKMKTMCSDTSSVSFQLEIQSGNYRVRNSTPSECDHDEHCHTTPVIHTWFEFNLPRTPYITYYSPNTSTRREIEFKLNQTLPFYAAVCRVNILVSPVINKLIL